MSSYQKSDIKMVPPSCYSENKRLIFKPKTQTVTEKMGVQCQSLELPSQNGFHQTTTGEGEADGNVKGVKMVGAQIHSLC